MENICFHLCMLIFMVQYPAGFSLINNNTSINHVCRQNERQLLFQLKQELPPVYPGDYYKTKYWNGSRDCCQWDGVTCDDLTGHVSTLDLSYNYQFNIESDIPLTGELTSSSSLFHLTRLHSLNLAFNDFGGSTIPLGFARLNTLTHLNLSATNFAGEIPIEFYHLSNLLSLDLSTDYQSFDQDRIRCDIKRLFGNMTRLRVLVLPGQNLSHSQFPMNMSSFLTHLDLANTGLHGNLPATIFEKPNLKILNLNGNGGLTVSLPKSQNRSNLIRVEFT